MITRLSSTLRRTQTAYSLVEVLVALFVLAVGLLGLAALQTTSFQFNSGSYARTQATLIAYEIIDRIRANPSGDYQVPDAATATTKKAAPPKNCHSATCSSAELALFDLSEWYEEQARVLPEPTNNPSTIELSGGIYTITIRWTEHESILDQVWNIAI